MFSEKLVSRISELYKIGQTGYTAAERAEIESISMAVLGKPVRKCNCKDRWRDAALESLIELRKNKDRTIMADSKSYFLKKGVVIPFEGKVYTNANLTDEIAKAYLAAYPGGAKRFEVIPKETPKPKKAPKAQTGETAE